MSQRPKINQLINAYITYDLDSDIAFSVSCADYNLVFFSMIDFDLFATLIN